MNSATIDFVSLFLKNDSECREGLVAFNCDSINEGLAVRLLHHHLLASRAFRLLQDSQCLQKFSEESQQSLERGYYYSHRQHEWSWKAIHDLQTAFDTLKIPVLFIKGATLAKKYYPISTDRPMADVDFVIPSEHRTQALSLISKMGYLPADGSTRFYANRNKIDFFHKDNPQNRIECHLGLGFAPYNFHEIWEHTEMLDGFLTLQPEIDYCFVLFHALIQHRLQKLGWLLDLAQMGRSGIISQDKLSHFLTAHQLNHAKNISDYWITNKIEGKKTQNQIKLDYFWHSIVNAEIEQQIFKIFCLRLTIANSFFETIKYAVLRKLQY